MKYSENYRMNKPELNEQYRLEHWNDNTDIIDSELKRIDDLESNIQNVTDSTFRTALLNFCYPIGSLYWSSKDTDPSTLFGGTWVQIKDRFIWVKGDEDTVNATGGSKTVQLTESNLPAHTHSFNWSGSHTHKRFLNTGTDGWKVQVQGSTSSNIYAPCQQGNIDPYDNFAAIEDSSITISGPTGNGNGTASAISIMPPYIVKFCWERTA